eukprot:jgi/Picsp_1/513/NSC_00511-R1_expressed protein [Chlorella variabilis]
MQTSLLQCSTRPFGSVAMKSRNRQVGCQRQRSPRTVVRAAWNDEMVGIKAMEDIKRRSMTILEKHDFLSAGMGALMVTGFCVSKGQDLGTALWITIASTVTAAVVNDVFFNGGKK